MQDGAQGLALLDDGAQNYHRLTALVTVVLPQICRTVFRRAWRQKFGPTLHDWGINGTFEEEKARDYDLLYPQHCGGTSTNAATGGYSSVFALVRTEDISAGTYGITTAPPGIPTWRPSVAGPGKIILNWDKPEFLGGGVPEQFEVKFKIF